MMRVLFADELMTLEYPPEWEVDLIHVDTPERAIRRLQDSRLAAKTESKKHKALSYTPFGVIFLGSADMVPVAEWIREHNYPAPVLIHTPVENDRNALMNAFRGFRHRISDGRGKFLRYLDRARPIDLSVDLDRSIKVKLVA